MDIELNEIICQLKLRLYFAIGLDDVCYFRLLDVGK